MFIVWEELNFYRKIKNTLIKKYGRKNVNYHPKCVKPCATADTPPLSTLFGLCCAPHNKPNKVDSVTAIIKKNKIYID